jgi:hypothetical protein
VGGIKRQRRYVLNATVRWVISAAVLAGATYVLDRVVGPRHGLWGAAAVGAGAYVLADCVGRAVRAVRRRGRAAPVVRNSEPACGVLPVPAPEVLALVDQGWTIQAIKRYRELNPGVGLRDARDVVEGLIGRVR